MVVGKKSITGLKLWLCNFDTPPPGCKRRNCNSSFCNRLLHPAGALSPCLSGILSLMLSGSLWRPFFLTPGRGHEPFCGGNHDSGTVAGSNGSVNEAGRSGSASRSCKTSPCRLWGAACRSGRKTLIPASRPGLTASNVATTSASAPSQTITASPWRRSTATAFSFHIV